MADNVIYLHKKREEKREEETIEQLNLRADAVENLVQAFKTNQTRLEADRKKANEKVKRSYRLTNKK